MRRSWPFLGCWVCLLLPGHLIAQTVPGTITTIAGTGEGGYTGDSGPATLAKLSLPSGVAVDPKGNIYVADTSNRRIRRIGFDGTIATIAEGWVTGANGDTRMNVYLAIGNRIRQVEADGSLTTIANEDGQGSGLRAAAMDAQGNVYVAEEESHRIRRVGPDGRHTTFAGTGEAGYSGDGGSAAQAKLNGPRGVAVDAQGNVYIADTENGRIRRVGPDGAIVTFVGLETGAGPSAGPVVLSRLNRPMAVAVDAAGNLYIADTGNHRIRRVGVDGLISAWAGTGAVGYAGDGGAADQAWLSRPEGIAVDAQGNTYIADTGNHRIRRVSAAAPSAAQPPPALPPDTVSPPPATTPIPPPPPPGGTPTPTPPGSTVSSLDFDGDGTVGFSDYFLFADGFGKEAVGGRQDLNGNGIVDGEDLLRFADGFGQPAVSTPLPSVVDGPNQGTKAVISQERGNWNVTLSGATAVNGAAVRLTYDSTRVQVGDLGSTTRPQGWVLASWTRRDTLEIATAYLNSVTPSAGLAGDFLLMSIPMSGDTSAARVVDITLRGSQPGERNRIGTASIQYSSPVPAPGPAGTPIISLWPLSLSFGDMQTGRQQPLNLPIGNTGNAPLVVSSITVTGPSAGEFAVSPTAFSVNSGAAAQTVTVTFSPSSVGAKSAALSITHNAAGSPISVSLSGTGASAPTSQVAPGTITTTAGTGDPGFTGDGGLATQARLNWPQGVAVDAQGNVYVCDSINNRVRRVGASGVIATFAGSGPTGSGQGGFSGNGGPATQAGISNPTGVAVDAQGYVYIAEGGHVRRVGPDGTITAFVDIPAVGIAIDAQGNTYTADGSRIRHLSPDGVVTTIAGMGRPDFLGDGGPATQAGFMNAFGVAVDAQGNVYIVDSGRNRVRRVGRDGVITTFAGTGANSFSGDGGPATQASLQSPWGVAVDGNGSVYITEVGRIRRVDADGVIATVAGSGTGGFSGDGGPATQAGLGLAQGIAVDGQGVLYISDTSNHCVRRVSPGGTAPPPAPSLGPAIITTIAGTGDPGSSGDGGPAVLATLDNPGNLAVDAQGNVYLTDAYDRVRRIGPDGIITTFAGTGRSGFSGDGGPAIQAELNNPSGVAVDANGDVYFGDHGNNRIRRVGAAGIISTIATGTAEYPFGVSFAIGPIGDMYISDTPRHRVYRIGPDGVITTFAGSGPTAIDAGDFGGDGGPATQARLYWPMGLAVDAQENVYIADNKNHRIRRVGPDGIITTFAGTGQWRNPGDGRLATQAGLNFPSDVAVDTGGNVYIAQAHRIRRVGPDGIITTFAGTGMPGFSGDGGLATEAALGGWTCVAVGVDGTVYISDSFNNRVRRVGPGSGAQPAQPSLPSPTIGLSASYLSFPSTQTGTTAQQTLAISNTGTTTLTVANISVTGAAAGQFRVSPTTATVAPGQNQLLTITFAPTSAGAKSALLSLTHNAAAIPSTVSLSGTGTAAPAPDIDVLPVALDFGEVQTRQTKLLSLLIANRGQVTLTVSSITSSSAVFRPSPIALTIAPGDSQRVSVSFIPVAAGAQSGTLTVTSADPDEQTVKVALTGNATVPPTPKIEVFPSALNLGAVNLGQTKSATIEVSNVGGGTLRVANIVFSNPDFSIDATSFSLRPGEKKSLIITFMPSRAANVNESLDIPSDDPEVRLTQVPVRAMVRLSTVGPIMAIPGNSLDFGQVDLGQNATLALPIRNDGTGSLTVYNVASDNIQVVASPTSLTIGPQETRTLTVTFRPMPGRPYSGRLTLSSNDAVQPQVGVSWSASEVKSPYLQVTSLKPANGAYNVATNTQIQLSFSEPLFFRRGFTALDLDVHPEPLSGPVDEDMQVRGDGRTAMIPVQLARNTVYRLVIYGATSRSGLELYDMMEVSFSTGSSAPVLATLSGGVSLAAEQSMTGSVYLFDASSHLVAQSNVALNNGFELDGIAAGEYTLYVDGALADGRVASGSYDRNADGVADVVRVQAGVDQPDLRMVPVVIGGTGPAASDMSLQVDLDSSIGNQRLTSLGTSGGQEVVLEVYANNTTQLTGAGVTVAYDTSKAWFVGAEEGEALLKQNGGTALFLNHVDPQTSTVQFGGAIMGPTAATAVSGSGLLGRFRFKLVEGFSGRSELKVTQALLQTLSGRSESTPNLVASLSSGGLAASGPAFSLSAGSLEFPSTPVGATSRKTVTVTNPGQASQAITGVTLAGTAANQFRASPSKATVPAGGSQAITVTFAPTSAGAKAASLSIAHNAAGSPATISLTGTASQAAGTVVQVAVGSGSGGPGSTVVIPISVDRAQGIAGGDLTLNYDATVLKARQVQGGDLLSKAGIAVLANLVTPGKVVVSMAGVSGLASGSGVLLTVTLEVKSGAALGSTRLTLEATLADDQGQELASTTSSGSVTIGGAMVGDVNDDHAVNSADAILVLRHSAGLSTLGGVQQQAGDVNGDGQMNSADAILILRKSAGLLAQFPRSGKGAVGLASELVRLGQAERTAAGVAVPLLIDTDVAGADLTIRYQTAAWRMGSVEASGTMLVASNPAVPGVVRLSLARGHTSGPATVLLHLDGSGDGLALELEGEVYGQEGDLLGAAAAQLIAPAPVALSGYPNPFNASTTLQYELAEAAQVGLVVYDVTGALVRRLVSDWRGAGQHAVVWDGRDERGQEVGTGLYLSCLATDRVRQIHKLMLLK